MNTLHLKYAVEVERTQSITQAAENLFMAQPNLSKAIRELEDTLGISIFERSSKGVIPTQKGSEFLAYAKNVLAEIEKMESLARPDNPDRQRFSISIPRGSYIASAFTMFASGLDMGKDMEINLKETNSMEAIANVAEGRFSLGIIRCQKEYVKFFLNYLEEKDLSHKTVWEFDELVVMSAGHPLAQKPAISYKDLDKYVEIIHGDTVIPYLPAGESRKPEDSAHARKRIYVYERCTQFDLLDHIPSTYMWVSAIPQEWLDRYGLVQRACRAENHSYKDLLIYPKNYVLSDLDDRFVRELQRSKEAAAGCEYS